MIAARQVKLFKNGRNQAVRIPREFELPGEDAIMRREGDRLIIEPSPPPSLLGVLATLAPHRWREVRSALLVACGFAPLEV